MTSPEPVEPGSSPSSAEPLQKRDPADAFARVTRAIRLTFVLETRTHRELEAMRAGLAAATEARRAAEPEMRRKAAQAREDARAGRLHDLVGKVIEAEAAGLAEARDTYEALEERLDCDEAYGDVVDMPLREAVERLCADLALTPDWSRWTGEGWAEPIRAERPPYSPFRRPSRKPFRFHRMTSEERDSCFRAEVPGPRPP